MIGFTAVFDFFLYVVFAFVAGSIVLQFIPEAKKPLLAGSRKFILLCITGIIIFSAATVVELAAFLAEFEGWPQSLMNTVTDYRVGQGWVLIVLFSIILGAAVYFGASKYIQAFYLFLMILVVGFYSHVSTLDFLLGSLSHVAHFLFLVLWAGVLLHVAWLTKEGTNWAPFLKWFTPFALICMAGIVTSGLVIMFFFVEPADYANSWVLPYGQTLLLKHLSIVPLLAAAVINGFLNKKRIFERSWLKAETFLLLLVFGLTAYMSKLAPPHNVNETLRMEGTAPLLGILKGDQFIPVTATIDWSLNGILLMLSGLLLLLALFLSHWRQIPAWLSAIFGIGFVACSYLGLMLNMSF